GALTGSRASRLRPPARPASGLTPRGPLWTGKRLDAARLAPPASIRLVASPLRGAPASGLTPRLPTRRPSPGCTRDTETWGRASPAQADTRPSLQPAFRRREARPLGDRRPWRRTPRRS